MHRQTVLLNQTETECLLYGLRQLELQSLLGLITRQVKQIEAGVRDRQKGFIVGRLEVELSDKQT